MANICLNVLTITPLEGQKLPDGLLDAITEEDGFPSLEKAVPVPAELEYEDDSDWMVENWGTDGLLADSSVEQVGDAIYGNLDTRWEPPVGWTLAVSKLFPTARFSLMYMEPGIQFGGELVAVAGGIEHEAQEDEVTFERWTLMGCMVDDFIESHVEDAAELDCIIDDPSVSDNILKELLAYDGDEPALTEEMIERIKARLNEKSS